MSEKYVNYYIELLTNTMQDAVLRNVSLQTNLKISDEAIGELNQKVEELENIVESLRNETTNSQQSANEVINNTIKEKDRIVREISEDKDKIIDELKKEIIAINNMRQEYENVRFVITEQGGHSLEFPQGWKLESWSAAVALDFLADSARARFA